MTRSLNQQAKPLVWQSIASFAESTSAVEWAEEYLSLAREATCRARHFSHEHTKASNLRSSLEIVEQSSRSLLDHLPQQALMEILLVSEPELARRWVDLKRDVLRLHEAARTARIRIRKGRGQGESWDRPNHIRRASLCALFINELWLRCRGEQPGVMNFEAHQAAEALWRAGANNRRGNEVTLEFWRRDFEQARSAPEFWQRHVSQTAQAAIENAETRRAADVLRENRLKSEDAFKSVVWPELEP